MRDIQCPYGIPGDRLLVREDSWIWCHQQPNGKTPTGRDKFRYVPVGQHVVYKAGAQKPTQRIDDDPSHMWKFKPGRFMPRWASRITLEVTDVRAQRLGEISEEDAVAEGCLADRYRSGRDVGTYETARIAYERLWESINGSWNPEQWVWAVSFKRIEQEMR